MLILKYFFFSVFAIVVNLSAQIGCTYLYQGSLSIYLELLIGTLSGLIVKYLLDKKYIFYYQSQGASQEVKSVFLYSFTGVFTTLIFWGVEVGFDLAFPVKSAKYFGGALGLAIGYSIKFFLDKKFVFLPSRK